MSESEPMGRTRPYVVLIVDDEPLVRLVARASLESAGFEVAEAEGGAQGIDLFASIRPDFVLLDVQMPDLDGFEVCETIRSSDGAKGSFASPVNRNSTPVMEHLPVYCDRSH